MEGRRFDALTKALTKGNVFKGLVGGVAATSASYSVASAQDDDTANAGNGGVATANANGGTVTIGNITTGNNTGNDIVIGDTEGTVTVAGGSVSNTTSIDISADGGIATADASGGDGNVAFAS